MCAAPPPRAAPPAAASPPRRPRPATASTPARPQQPRRDGTRRIESASQSNTNRYSKQQPHVTHLEAVDEVDGLPRVARQHRLGRRQHVLADVLRRAGEHLARVALHVLAEGARDGGGRVLRRISAAKQEHNTTV